MIINNIFLVSVLSIICSKKDLVSDSNLKLLKAKKNTEQLLVIIYLMIKSKVYGYILGLLIYVEIDQCTDLIKTATTNVGVVRDKRCG